MKGRASIGIGLRLGVGRCFEAQRGSVRDHGVPALLDAVHQRLGIVAKTERRLEGIVFLQIAEGESALDLFVDAVHSVLNCYFFHFIFWLLVKVLGGFWSRQCAPDAQTPGRRYRPG